MVFENNCSSLWVTLQRLADKLAARYDAQMAKKEAEKEDKAEPPESKPQRGKETPQRQVKLILEKLILKSEGMSDSVNLSLWYMN